MLALFLEVGPQLLQADGGPLGLVDAGALAQLKQVGGFALRRNHADQAPLGQLGQMAGAGQLVVGRIELLYSLEAVVGTDVVSMQSVL